MPKSFSSELRRIPARCLLARNFELLETRELLSVTVDANGWTQITPPSGARIIYCSSSTGNDTNTGLSAAYPVATIQRAEQLLQNHTGDQLLLKAGDVWHTDFIFWGDSGASAQDPMVIGSYGTGARPTIMSGKYSGFETGKVSAPEVDYLAIIGIHFWADGRDPSLTSTPVSSSAEGIEFLTKSNDILIENCEIQDYAVNIGFQDYLGPIENVSIRRNIVIDAWSTNSHAEGLYVTGVSNVLIEGNDFDHNGYNSQVPGSVQTWFNHDAYLSSDNTNCVIDDNIFANAAGYGLQDRPGGVVEGNAFIDDPVGMTFGLVDGASTTPGGVTGDVSGNFFIGGGNIGNVQEGSALQIGNIQPGAGAVVSNNIFTQSIPNAAAAIILSYGTAESNSQDAVGINNLTLKNNIIYDWTTGAVFSGGQVPGGTGHNALNNVTFSANDFENLTGFAIENDVKTYLAQETFTGNDYYNVGQTISGMTGLIPDSTELSSPMAFPDPNRSVATYDDSIGGAGSIDSFLQGAAQVSEQNWNAQYIATSLVGYIEQGFALSSSPTPPTNPTGTSATSTFSALQFNSQNGHMKSDNFKGLGYIYGGDWAEYNQIDFGTGVSTFSAMIAAMPGLAGSIQLRLDSPTGTLIGTLNTTATGAWSNYTLQSTTVSGATGVHNLYLVFVGGKGVCNVENFTFA